jgi:DNA gyrase subunit A
MMIADDGTIIRVKATEISIIGRNTKGVRVMKLNDTANIVCVAVTPSEEAEEELADSLVETAPKAPVSTEIGLDEVENTEDKTTDDEI